MAVDLGSMGAGRWVGLLAATLLAAALPGCEGGGPDTSTEIFCSAMCGRSVQCGGWDDAGACETECQRDSGLEDFRPEFIAAFAACFRGLSCSVFFAENSFDPCWDQARADLEPSEETRAFCTARSRTWFECGYRYFPDECERDWALRAGRSLERVAQCHGAVACDQLGSCTGAALEAGR